MEKVRYMISDASSMVNVESHVLRYWEDELELNIPRNEMGHRYYTQENIKEFQYIKELKEKGYQLKAIKMIVHNGDMEQRLPELTGNEADKPGGVKNHQVYFKNPETLALAEAKQSSAFADRCRCRNHFQCNFFRIVFMYILHHNLQSCLIMI